MRARARRGSADYAHEWPLKATGDRRSVWGGEGEEETREKDDARSNRSLRRKKWISYPRAEEKKKKREKRERPRVVWRSEPCARLASVHTRPNKFFAAKRKAVRLYEIARRRNYFISLRAAAVIT